MGKQSSQHKPAKAVPNSSSDLTQKLFMGTMLNMSLQMAVVVLVPTLGGFKLDTYFDTSPYLTLTGLVLAMTGMVLIVRHAVADLNKYMIDEAPQEKKDKND